MDSQTIIKLDLEDEAKRPVVKYLEPAAPPFRFTEMLRYSGVPLDVAKRLVSQVNGDSPKVDSQYEPLIKDLEKAVSLTQGKLNFKVGFISGKLHWDEEGYPVLPFPQRSENLKKNLKNCCGYVIFAATIGAEMDRLIRRYEISNAPMGVLLQGIGAERAESLCNAFNDMVKAEAEKIGFTTHPRFSPGFGDLSITVQRDLLDCLDAGRRMGITLSDSYLMAPSKSVTAIIGLEKAEAGVEG